MNPLARGSYQPIRKDRENWNKYTRRKLFALNGTTDFRFYEFSNNEENRLNPYFKYVTFNGILYEFQ
jgi:hypothetical protein